MRARAYAQTGVDGLFLVGVTSRAQLDAISAAVEIPLLLGGVSGDLRDRDYLASRRVRIALQGHLPFAAGVRAVYETMRALRDGTQPDQITTAAPAEMMRRLTREADYAAWTKDLSWRVNACRRAGCRGLSTPTAWERWHGPAIGTDRRRRCGAERIARPAVREERHARGAGGARSGQAGGAGAGDKGGRDLCLRCPKADDVAHLFAQLDAAPDVVVFNASARARGPVAELDPARRGARHRASAPSAASWSGRRRRARCCRAARAPSSSPGPRPA